MVNEGKGLSWVQLVAVAVVVGGASWLGWRVYLNGGHLLPASSWVSAVLLGVMALLVVAAGLPVRRFLRGESTKSLSPIRAARTLVLAQAAALTGASVLGWYAAQALLIVPDLDIPSYQVTFWQLVATSVGALVLAAGGMATQRMCRIDQDDRDRRDDERRP